MSECGGTKADHCCWVNGEVCPHFETDVDGRSISCSLLRIHKNWNAVHKSAEYLQDVQPMWDRIHPGEGCGDWPGNTKVCAVCGITGDNKQDLDWKIDSG